MRRARLCLVVGSTEMFLCCSMTIGALGFVGVVEQAVRANVVKIDEINREIFMVFTFD